ncbi:hypothetical protein K2X85_06805 [bacterium]|nr:hypothetical protein [bacterium]
MLIGLLFRENIRRTLLGMFVEEMPRADPTDGASSPANAFPSFPLLRSAIGDWFLSIYRVEEKATFR